MDPWDVELRQDVNLAAATALCNGSREAKTHPSSEGHLAKKNQNPLTKTSQRHGHEAMMGRVNKPRQERGAPIGGGTPGGAGAGELRRSRRRSRREGLSPRQLRRTGLYARPERPQRRAIDGSDTRRRHGRRRDREEERDWTRRFSSAASPVRLRLSGRVPIFGGPTKLQVRPT